MLKPCLSRPYLPAVVTLIGAVLVAVGLFFRQIQPPATVP